MAEVTNAEKTATVAELQKKLDDMALMASKLRSENEKLEETVAALRAQIAKAARDASADDSDLIEIVAVPERSFVNKDECLPVPQSIMHEGKSVKRKVKEGDVYFYVPPELAERLLASDGGIKYRLVGPCDSFTVRRRVGLRVSEEKIPRYSKKTVSSGAAFWQPVEVIESKDGTI